MYYFIDHNRQQKGPVPPSELTRYGVTTETYVWRKGMPNCRYIEKG